MSTLAGRNPANTYGNLLQVDNANAGLDVTLRSVEDGKGNVSPLMIGTGSAGIKKNHNDKIDDYTLVLTDSFKSINMSKATALTLTIPLNASVAFPIGILISVTRTGVGILTIAGTGGVTVTGSRGVLIDPGLNKEMILEKTDTNTWLLQNGTPGMWINKGDHDASTTTFPTGTFEAFNTKRVSVSGTISGVYCPAGSILIAMQNSPTSDWDALTGWKLI